MRTASPLIFLPGLKSMKVSEVCVCISMCVWGMDDHTSLLALISSTINTTIKIMIKPTISQMNRMYASTQQETTMFG